MCGKTGQSYKRTRRTWHTLIAGGGRLEWFCGWRWGYIQTKYINKLDAFHRSLGLRLERLPEDVPFRPDNARGIVLWCGFYGWDSIRKFVGFNGEIEMIINVILWGELGWFREWRWVNWGCGFQIVLFLTFKAVQVFNMRDCLGELSKPPGAYTEHQSKFFMD